MLRYDKWHVQEHTKIKNLNTIKWWEVILQLTKNSLQKSYQRCSSNSAGPINAVRWCVDMKQPWFLLRNSYMPGSGLSVYTLCPISSFLWDGYYSEENWDLQRSGDCHFQGPWASSWQSRDLKPCLSDPSLCSQLQDTMPKSPFQ